MLQTGRKFVKAVPYYMSCYVHFYLISLAWFCHYSLLWWCLLLEGWLAVTAHSRINLFSHLFNQIRNLYLKSLQPLAFSSQFKSFQNKHFVLNLNNLQQPSALSSHFLSLLWMSAEYRFDCIFTLYEKNNWVFYIKVRMCQNWYRITKKNRRLKDM